MIKTVLNFELRGQDFVDLASFILSLPWISVEVMNMIG